MLFRSFALLATLTAVSAATATVAAQSTIVPYAHYRLGEEDLGNPTSGGTPELGLTLDEVKYGGTERDLTLIGAPVYSDFVPPGGYSSLSMKFDGASDFGGPATQWHGQAPNSFRIGMEAWVWVDPAMQNTEFVPFANGSGMGFIGTADGQWRFYGDFGGPATPMGGPIAYGEWQHIAFNTNGSQWNFYLNGDRTIAQHGGFYGATNGDITIGGDLNGERRMIGYVDEARLFRWTNILPNQLALQPSDLLIFAGLTAGDVNGDDVVDTSDYDIWRSNVGNDVSEINALERVALGDVNHDKLIDLDDFSIIKANQTPGASPVPEPATSALLFAGAIAAGAVKMRRRIKMAIAAAVACGVACTTTSDAQAQLVAQWEDGVTANWNDDHWTGGSGANGEPTILDTAEFLTAGTATINSDVGAYAQLITRKGGTINITPTGAVQFQDINLGWDGAGGNGALNVEGSLDVTGTLSLGRGNDGNGNAASHLNITGSAVVTVNSVDAFWAAPGGIVEVTGPDADVNLGGFGLGPSRIVANITGANHSTIKAPGGTDFFTEGSAGAGASLAVNFDLDEYAPSLGHSWVLVDTTAFTNAALGLASGAIIKHVSIDHLETPGLRAELVYEPGGTYGQLLAVDVLNNLNLKIDRDSGEAILENPTVGGSAFSIDGLMITSASGSLNAAGYDGTGLAGWAPGLNQSASTLSESSLGGSTTINVGSTLPLGDLFDVGGDEDLIFEFHVAGGSSIRGTVQFVDGTPGQLGDTDGDGDVDITDLNNVRNNFGASGLGDTDDDNDVDITDLNNVRNNFGAGPGANPVPEPSTAVLALGLGLGLAAWLRRRKS